MQDETTGIEDPGAQQRAPREDRRWRPTARGLRLTSLVLVGLLVLALAVGGWFFSRERAARSEARDRADARQVAEQFALRVDTVDGADTDGYVDAIAELLTTKYKAEFTQQFEPFKQVYAEGKATGTGKLLLSGVASSDADSARVLVVHDAEFSSDINKATRHHRWSVELRKVKGSWLVDDFTQVS